MSKAEKFWLFLLIISAIFWLGTINGRYLIGNDLITYDEFSFRTSIPPDEENLLFKLISYASIVIIISYVFVLLSATMFLIKTKLTFKENGWLMMSTILFYIFVPVEIYTYYLDMKFFFIYLSNPPNHDELLRIFGERIGFLKGVPWIGMLSYYAIIALAIFQPMKKTKEQLEEEKRKVQEKYSYTYDLHEDDDLKI
ncbi:MAG: hypothetical protein ACP5P3_07120 [Ignavibacteria bacterium]